MMTLDQALDFVIAETQARTHAIGCSRVEAENCVEAVATIKKFRDLAAAARPLPISVPSIAAALGITEEQLQSDLEALEQMGLIRRVAPVGEMGGL